MATIRRKTGDTRSIRAKLTTNRRAVDLRPGGVACSVRYLQKPKIVGVGSTVDAAATVVQTGSGDAATEKGIVEYVPQAADVDVAGTHWVEWQVVFPDGTVETFPNGGYMDLVLVEDLN